MTRQTIRADKLGRRQLSLDVRTLPDAARYAMQDLLPHVLTVLPPETQDLVIKYDSSPSHWFASVGRLPDYDRVEITIRPKFLELCRERQRRTLCHEVAHVWMTRLSTFVDQIVEAYVKDESSRKLVSDRLIAEEERLVEHLGELLAEACVSFSPVGVRT